jgi:predicted amidohydrolase
MTGREKTLTVAVWQAEPGSGIGSRALGALGAISPDLIVLPEYFWVRPEDKDANEASRHYDEDRETLAAVSRELDAVWIGGTLVEPGGDGRLYNTALVYDQGRTALSYRKRRLMPGEAAGGIHPGSTPAVADIRGVRLGLLICADVFEPASYADLAAHRPHVIGVPTNSPYRPDDRIEDKLQRDETWFAAGARRSGAWVLKACTVGKVFGRPVQGRSLIAGPEGVLVRVPPEKELEPQLLTARISL